MASVTVGRQYSTAIGYLNVKKFKKCVNVDLEYWIHLLVCPYLLQITVRFLGERRTIDILSDTQLPQLSSSTLQVLLVCPLLVFFYSDKHNTILCLLVVLSRP